MGFNTVPCPELMFPKGVCVGAKSVRRL
jgi:hypothetical protein